jgi:hypothetical protein
VIGGDDVAGPPPELVVLDDDGVPGVPAEPAGSAMQGLPVLEVAVPGGGPRAIRAGPARSSSACAGYRRPAARCRPPAGRGAVYYELDERLSTVTSLSFVGGIYRRLGRVG